MKKTILTLIILLISYFTYGQLSSPECTTINYDPDPLILNDLRIPDHSSKTFHLKAYVHVLTHTEKGPGQTKMGINEAMKRLYDEFDDLGIYLVWDGNVDYIVNNDWYNNPENYVCVDYDLDDNEDECPNYGIFDHNYHTDGIDIYLGSSLNEYPVGRAYDISGKTAFIVSGYSNVEDPEDIDFWPQSPVIIHELGHVFYLYHTFYGTFGSSGCSECAEPNSNQWMCGDFIYDTPPDPKFGSPNEIDDNCQFTGSGNDNCGVPYNPLTNNYMSSSYLDCRTDFTLGQVRRMKNAIKILPVLQSAHLQDYTYIRGNSIVCTYGEYDIFSNDTNNLVIENSSNITLNIINSNSTNISIEVINYNSPYNEGQPAWFEVKKNGIVLAKKDLWIGLPQTVSPNIISGADDVYINDEEIYTIPTQIEGTFTEKGVQSYYLDLPGHSPTANYPFINNFGDWQMDYLSKYNFIANTKVGDCSGEIKLYGINECGDGIELADDDGLDVHVNGGGSDCPPEDLDIVYYPNPADDLLNIDLSLQDYKIFDIVVYNDNQVAVYTAQSSNVIKTIDTFNLQNGSYYLHIYDGTDLILSKILIINHI